MSQVLEQEFAGFFYPADRITVDTLEKIRELSVGDWVEIEINKAIVRCKLSQFDKARDEYVFVNSKGQFVAEFSSDDLQRFYQFDSMKFLQVDELFNQALDLVSANRRSARKSA